MRRDRALSVAEKMDARDALNLLEGSGLSLLAAAQMALGRSSASVSTKIEHAIDELIRDNLRRKLRGTTLQFYEERLRVFASGWHEDATLDDVTRADLRAWLVALQGSDGTRRATYRAVARLFKFALQQEPPLCRVNPAENLKLPEVKGHREIEILSPKDAAAIMTASSRGDMPYVAALALMLFVGVRPMEIRCKGKPELKWRHIDFNARTIRIPAEIAKTRTARIIEDAPDNLWLWLRRKMDQLERDTQKATPEKLNSEDLKARIDDIPICPGMIRQAQRMARDAINQGRAEKDLREWPKDGPRHSFATYHIAQLNEIGKTSMIMGHEGSTQMIHRHYRGLATKAEADEYFAICPPSAAAS